MAWSSPRAPARLHAAMGDLPTQPRQVSAPKSAGAKVFISYRHTDVEVGGYVWGVYEVLKERCGVHNVFKDVDSIPLGESFPEHIRQAVRSCDVALVFIGPRWIGAKGESGRRRLDNPKDWVRLEVAEALRHPHVLVIPILVAGARMPSREELPPAISRLADIQAFTWPEQGAIQQLLPRIEGWAAGHGDDGEGEGPPDVDAPVDAPTTRLREQVVALCEGMLREITDDRARRAVDAVRRRLLSVPANPMPVRADALAADEALTALEQLSFRLDLPVIRDRAQALRDGGSGMALINVARWSLLSERGELDLPDDKAQELAQLLSTATPSGEPALVGSTDRVQGAAAARGRAQAWRRFENGGSASPQGQRVAEDVVRLYEQMSQFDA